MSPRRRAIAGLALFVVGAGLMIASEAPATLIVGLAAILAAIGVAATAILTHQALSSPDDVTAPQDDSERTGTEPG